MPTLAQTQQLARKIAGQEFINLRVADGTYYLPSTLVLSSAGSGTEAAPSVHGAEYEGGALRSGGSKLPLTRKLYRNGIYSPTTPQNIEIV